MREEIASYFYLEFIDSVFEEKFRYPVEVHEKLKVALPWSYCVVLFRFSVNFPYSLRICLPYPYSVVVSRVYLYGNRIPEIHETKEELEYIEIIQWQSFCDYDSSLVGIAYLKEV